MSPKYGSFIIIALIATPTAFANQPLPSRCRKIADALFSSFEFGTYLKPESRLRRLAIQAPKNLGDRYISGDLEIRIEKFDTTYRMQTITRNAMAPNAVRTETFALDSQCSITQIDYRHQGGEFDTHAVASPEACLPLANSLRAIESEYTQWKTEKSEVAEINFHNALQAANRKFSEMRVHFCRRLESLNRTSESAAKSIGGKDGMPERKGSRVD